MMHVCLLCLCEVASIDGLMPFLVACHCTNYIVIFCSAMYLANIFISLYRIKMACKLPTVGDWRCSNEVRRVISG